MALDPRSIMNDVVGKAANPPEEPPALLSQPLGWDEHLPPVRQADELERLHRTWAGLATPPPISRRDLMGRIRAVMASEPVATAERQDRTLIGQLIQAVDTLGARCDELAGRVERLETLLDETVSSFGADVVAVRAALQRLEQGVGG
jgi:hypothetical protein